ncbi:MAG: Reducing end xylose-releasing exo-oligoxylanase [Bacteroidetes bacterium ADurb.BinA104]|nr:MAG: Reducing end xylose-releasing exo-oligoxylanase [Bacteroidetes bacterium ADurb.BinA104]
MRKLITTAICVAALCMAGTVISCGSVKKMKPATKGYIETGKYRNYLKELGYSQTDIDNKIAEIYYIMFDSDNPSYFDVEIDGIPMGYVSDVKNRDVRTEGQSYGMMVSIQLDRQDRFDRIWRWTKHFMRHNEEGPSHGLYAWSCRTDGSRNANGSASDGELYFVTDLLLASRRWGNDGDINYLAEAQELLNDLFSKDGTGGVTNIINMEKKLINFCPDTRSNEWTDPSYHLPAFYEIWAESAQDGREELYRELADSARAYLHRATDPVTGLNPDQSQFDGTPNRGSEFHYDSWRVPMNIAMDFTWYHKDAEWQAEYADKIQRTIIGRYGLKEFPDQFALNGDEPRFIMGAGGYRKLRHSIGFVGALATTSLMTDNEYSQDLVHHMFELKHEPYEDGYYDVYYDGFIYLFALLHLSGNYRMSW